MAADLYKPCLEAIRSVFGLILDLSDISNRPAETIVRDDALSGAIDVTGDLTDKVYDLFPHVTSIRMVSRMRGIRLNPRK